MSRTTLALSLLCALALTGCSKLIPRIDKVLPDETREYRRSESLPDLEVPPDLSSEAIQDTLAVPDIDETGTASYSTYQERIAARKRARELGAADESAIAALADEQVILVAGEGPAVWDRLREFWAAEGYELDLDDAELGIMETQWRASEQALTRDKFKLFAEAGQDPGTTVLYLSHLGEAQEPEGERLAWKPRPRDKALEESTAARLRTHFGAPPAPAAAAAPPSTEATEAVSGPAPAAGRPLAPTELVSAGEGRLYLRMSADFATAWRETAAALQRAGYAIVEEDRGRGTYFVRYTGAAGAPAQEEGLMSKLAFWKQDENEREISLTGVGDKTEIVVLDEDGNWDASPAAAELLQALQASLDNPG